MKKVKYLIIGAGISGLYFAKSVKEDYLIIEKENSVGGYCKTFKVGDFIWDYAGHFYHFKTEKLKNLFTEMIGIENIIKQKKNTKILYNGALIDYPFQKNIHQLEKDEFIDCMYDLYNRDIKESYDNFLDMLYGKFGVSIVEKFLKPYNEKLYACDLKKLDKDAMGRFFPYADLSDIINNMKAKNNDSYNDEFLYPLDGAQSFIDKLYEQLDKDKVLLNKEVVKIDVNQKTVLLNDNTEISYEYLINTSPLNKFLLLFNNKYDVIANDLSYNKVLVFNLGFSKKSNFKEHWIYIPDKNINFYRVGFYDNILCSDKLSMYIEIGFSKDDKVDIEKQLELTLQNLEKIGIIDKEQKLENYNYVIMDPAYVHINEKDTKLISNIMNELNANQIFSIGRYGKWTYCSMEDCMVECENVLNIIMEEGKKNES